MVQCYCLNVQLIILLILANGFSFIIGFETVTKARGGSLRSTRERKWFAKALSSPSLLRGHDENESSVEGSMYPENKLFLVENLERLDCGLDCRIVESSNEDEEDTNEFSSRYSVSINREPMGSNNLFLDDTKALKHMLISMDEVFKVAVQNNLPKKKLISPHSFVSSMSVIASLVLLLPTFHPGIDDLGLPRLFTYEHASNDLLWQSQLVAILQMVGAIMGVFRLPKHSPNVRTAGFVISALIITQLSLVVLSSLNGTNVYLFDAFSMQGRVLVSVVNTSLLIGSFDSLALIVGDKEKKGWETVPNYGSRPAAFFAVFPFHILICITGNAILPVLCDKESFVENALPFFGVFPGVQTLGYVATSLSIGLGALLATLQFEKKITSEVASFWNLVVITFFTYDGVKFVYLLGVFPERFAHSEYFILYTPHLQSLWHTNEVLSLGTVLAMIVGLRDLSNATILASAARRRNNRLSQEAASLALEPACTTKESSSLSPSDSNSLPLLTSDSKKYQDIGEVDERAYQAGINIGRIGKKNRVEREDAINSSFD
jgi:hypothetical protein